MISNSYLLISRLSDHDLSLVIFHGFLAFEGLDFLLFCGGIFPAGGFACEKSVWLASKLDLCSQEGKSLPIHEYLCYGLSW